MRSQLERRFDKPASTIPQANVKLCYCVRCHPKVAKGQSVMRKLRCSRKFHTPVDAVDLTVPRYSPPALFISTNGCCSTICLSGRYPHPTHLGSDFGRV